MQPQLAASSKSLVDLLNKAAAARPILKRNGVPKKGNGQHFQSFMHMQVMRWASDEMARWFSHSSSSTACLAG
jgi:hypothetical protein